MPEMLTTLVSANAVVAFDCVTIAALLAAIGWQRRHEDPSAGAYPWLAVTLLALAAHRVELIIAYLHSTPYNSPGLSVLTAIAATVTAMIMPRSIVGQSRKTVAADVENQNRQLVESVQRSQRAQAELQRHNKILALRISHLEVLLETEGWTTEKAKLLSEMRGSLSVIGEVLHGP